MGKFGIFGQVLGGYAEEKEKAEAQEFKQKQENRRLSAQILMSLAGQPNVTPEGRVMLLSPLQEGMLGNKGVKELNISKIIAGARASGGILSQEQQNEADSQKEAAMTKARITAQYEARKGIFGQMPGYEELSPAGRMSLLSGMSLPSLQGRPQQRMEIEDPNNPGSPAMALFNPSNNQVTLMDGTPVPNPVPFKRARAGAEFSVITGAGTMPIGVRDRAGNVFVGAKNIPEGGKQLYEASREAHRTESKAKLDRQVASLAGAIQRMDIVEQRAIKREARKDIRQYQTVEFGARDRLNIMERTLERIKKDPTQAAQGDVLLVANHIGMTLGLQKGARITRAIWEEAKRARPWYQSVIVTFTGGALTGASLSSQQRQQMVSLAQEQMEVAKERTRLVRDTYKDLFEGKDPLTGMKAGPPSVEGISDEVVQDFANQLGISTEEARQLLEAAAKEK